MTQVVASTETVAAVGERGGTLWVATRASRCCGGTVRLETATTPRPGRDYRRIARTPFEVFLASAAPPPAKLHVERSKRGRLDAYWNGCAWVT